MRAVLHVRGCRHAAESRSYNLGFPTPLDLPRGPNNESGSVLCLLVERGGLRPTGNASLEAAVDDQRGQPRSLTLLADQLIAALPASL